MSIPLKTRLYISGTFRVSGILILSPSQTHYLRHVLRLAAGVDIAVFNGKDGEWHAQIETLEKDAGTVRLIGQIQPLVDTPDCWLLFAPIKRQGIDLIAEKATELGISRLCPILTKYTAVSRVNVERLRANAVEAAQQCQRMDVPEVDEPTSLMDALEKWPSDRTLFVCAESGEDRSSLLESLQAEGKGRPAAILVSSEGGFAQSELNRLKERPFVRMVQLGPRILRSETACFAALSCWQMVCGDW